MSNIEFIESRSILRIEGDDRHSFLQGIITQDIEQLSPERAITSALLTPQGKILADFFLIESSDAIFLDCHADIVEALSKRLSMYKLRAKVSITPFDQCATLASPHPIDLDGAVAVFQDPRHDDLGWRAIAKPHKESVPEHTYHARRITCGVPEFGYDYSADEKFLTDINADVLNAVNYKKGCFIGQEVTSRMKRKGDIRKRSIIAKFADAVAPTGTAVTAGSSTLGEIMSQSGDQALAFIRLDRWEKAKLDQVPILADGKSLQFRVPNYLEHD
ncbi:CAF17-like 4Fe-4S cluster assembly/insertion protein YgfZ [Hyphococcus lacteus]|uniref:Folate-binding protein n=1 Tax=Hyphococcus lacteus TaxID=3143536 RepID=A0ABV3YZL6_9PROT